MPSALFKIEIGSIYKTGGHPALLPPRMALCTADMKEAIETLRASLQQAGGALILSDLFRSYDMQTQSHLDYVSGRKSAFSPPAGGSFHEAGRAFDLDLGRIHVSLRDLWDLAAPAKLVPIISAPDPNASEAWHFECRGSHQRVYEYYKAGKGTNFDKPYKAAAASAILSVGVPVDRFDDNQKAAYIQSGLIRMGAVIGNLDGQIGPKTRDALEEMGIGMTSLEEAVALVDDQLQREFPEEFFDRSLQTPGLVHA